MKGLRIRASGLAVGGLAVVVGMGLPVTAGAADAAGIASTVCVVCHGPDGNGIAAAFPKLAGQTPEYLTKQLSDFLGRKRKNAVMDPALANLKSRDAAGLAAHFAAMPASAGASENAALREQGKKIYESGNVDNGVPACAACHGETRRRHGGEPATGWPVSELRRRAARGVSHRGTRQ